MPPEQSINTALSLAAELGAEQSGPTRIEAPSPLSDLGLTRREIDVLRLLTEGGSDREIADALSISPRTVGGHVTNLLGKLEVRSRSAAAAYAIRLGVLEQREP
jgi:DNA-binding NarL/FixJ family response regulator